jgi:hypothetical protein
MDGVSRSSWRYHLAQLFLYLWLNVPALRRLPCAETASEWSIRMLLLAGVDDE